MFSDNFFRNESPVQYAAKAGNVDSLKLLIEKGKIKSQFIL